MTYQEIKQNKAIQAYIRKADESLIALGFTEHSFAHVTLVAETVKYILETLEFDPHSIEIGQIAGYLHKLFSIIVIETVFVCETP